MDGDYDLKNHNLNEIFETWTGDSILRLQNQKKKV